MQRSDWLRLESGDLQVSIFYQRGKESDVNIDMELSFRTDNSGRTSLSSLLESQEREGCEKLLTVDNDDHDGDSADDDDGNCPFFFDEPVRTNWD